MMNANTNDRLLALHRAMRGGNTERAYRLAAKLGFGPATTPDNLWEVVVIRLTGSSYGYAQADTLAGLPSRVPPVPRWHGRILPMC